MTANGVDVNGNFFLQGEVRPDDLVFKAVKTYPDHCVFLKGHASIAEHKLALLDWNSPLPLEEIDKITGVWGFEEGDWGEGEQGAGTFQISQE